MKKMFYYPRLFLTVCVFCCLSACGGGSDSPAPQTVDARNPSVARLWNEILLEAIRNDFARPTVHARNLFHISAAMYDAWAANETSHTPYLLNRTINGFNCSIDAATLNQDFSAKEKAISYAAYRLLLHRFRESPGANNTRFHAENLMEELGYEKDNTAMDTTSGDAAAVGNAIAECYIQYGLQDGSNETNNYANRFYSPVNPPIEPEQPGNPTIVDLARWQQIFLSESIDQSGNVVSNAPPFLSPEWGEVQGFALTDTDKTTFASENYTFNIYHDPGSPPLPQGNTAAYYKWTFALVAIWSSHLDSTSERQVDISPLAIGNIDDSLLPNDFSQYENFYRLFEGGDIGPGRELNPVTGEVYEPEIVNYGDYTRVLAEFWADGPDSETPPGHWFVILNQVNDHPLLDKRLEGGGDELGPLEWDVKSYFSLGGAMHDAAISAWSVKGRYDYIRPVSAIRAMADRGQSSDPNLASYHPDGLSLYEGYIELVEEGDGLAGANNEHVGKIKLFAWRGPQYIEDTATDQAGVGWILAENWWPYQRPSFVTPPFAGYVSGHSTYSRAAAEVLTLLTGNEFFPGGLGEFHMPQNDYLVFEEGPSQEVTLQWATYRDAASQCSLSRIWGGIHPPADDIPGRKMGRVIGINAFNKARSYFD